ncbi:MAG: AMP-binding protein [Acidimicrobiales bacterium]
MDWNDLLVTARTMRRAGIVMPHGPRRLLRARTAAEHWGLNYAGGFASAGALHADQPCVVDERGQRTWGEVDAASDAMANGLRARGIGEGDVVAVLCRNHRWFVIATAGLAKLGADILFLNTSFAGPQLREVVAREDAKALIYDEEYAELVATDGDVGLKLVAWHDGDPPPGTESLDLLIARAPHSRPPAPRRAGRSIILTSGTTGTPKGAPRDQETGIEPIVAMLDRIPYRARETMVVPAPLFHSWGFGNRSLSLLLGTTLVVRRRFDPEATLRDVARHRAQVLVAVPVMLQRILELPEHVRRRYDTSSLRVVPLSGSAIPGGLATRWMDEFGDNLYNLYGSTEVGWATIATPEDLRADPATAGRPPLHTRVELLDEHDRPVAQGETGRIFVGSELTFDGYTGGGDKARVGELVSTGDTGFFDGAGRLHVVGRDDEMIVSGGENVFPREVEDCIAEHPDVVEVAVIGVPDDEFGQRLKAFVVLGADATLDEAAVKALVKATLAGYKVPRDVVFLDELPRNPTGKVLKRELT